MHKLTIRGVTDEDIEAIHVWFGGSLELDGDMEAPTHGLIIKLRKSFVEEHMPALVILLEMLGLDWNIHK